MLTYSALGGRAARKTRKNPRAKPARAASGNRSQGWTPSFPANQVFAAHTPAHIIPPPIAMMNRRCLRNRSNSMGDMRSKSMGAKLVLSSLVWLVRLHFFSQDQQAQLLFVGCTRGKSCEVRFSSSGKSWFPVDDNPVSQDLGGGIFEPHVLHL